MKKHTLKGRTLAIITTLFIFFFFYITYFLHLSSMFYLYYIVSLTCVLFMSTNLLFMSLKFIKTRTEIYRNSDKKFTKKIKAFFIKLKTKLKIKPRQKKEKKPGAKPKRKIDIEISQVLKYLCIIIYFMSLYSIIKGMVFYFQSFPFNIFDYPVNGVFMLLFALICIILDRFIKYSENNSEFVQTILDNSKTYLKILSVLFITISACVFIEYYAKITFQKQAGNVLMIVFFYCALFTLISAVVVLMRKDYYTHPAIKIPLPSFRFGKKKENEPKESFVDYLEKNTGISMRSLWSVKYIKNISPTAIVLSVMALWLATGITTVNNYQQAAVYRIGKLQDKILQPGIHFTLPWPIDKVELYDTEKLSKTTIGYKSETSTDNIWTSSHGANEHKLLLGGGDELVSINLRLEYKINDLRNYLTVSVSPELLLEAMAYELVLDKTISTDLSSLLSINRYEFARSFKEEISQMLAEKNIGLEVVSVVLESIHPPMEIAHVYHGLISAEITADKYMEEARGYAAVKKANAETSRNTAVGTANAEHSEKTAGAKSSVAEFMASVEANKTYGNAYTYQKYLNAVRDAYGKANLIILGDGVNSDSIILGSLLPPDKKQEPETEAPTEAPTEETTAVQY